jgi:SAM-dependent MidA family methyltransferase
MSHRAHRFVRSGVTTPAINIFFQKDRSRVNVGPLSKVIQTDPPSKEPKLVVTSSSETPQGLSDQEINQQTTAADTPTSALYDEQLESLEVSPLAFALVEEIARNVLSQKSAALLVDYGENYPQVHHLLLSLSLPTSPA